uniref:Uncharacterized protein n=1 Tax=Glossina brevipalpis TaxID=37001 RepID=A0A1A9W4U1_9MUSC
MNSSDLRKIRTLLNNTRDLKKIGIKYNSFFLFILVARGFAYLPACKMHLCAFTCLCVYISIEGHAYTRIPQAIDTTYVVGCTTTQPWLHAIVIKITTVTTTAAAATETATATATQHNNNDDDNNNNNNNTNNCRYTLTWQGAWKRYASPNAVLRQNI